MFFTNAQQYSSEQECIPVGCVPAARRPYAGVCLSGGVSAWSGGLVLGGLPGPGGVCLVQGGGLVPGGVCLVPGGSAWSGGGVCLVPGGCGIPACTEADPPPPVNRMTNRCKNITLARTSLRPVMNKHPPPSSTSSFGKHQEINGFSVLLTYRFSGSVLPHLASDWIY